MLRIETSRGRVCGSSVTVWTVLFTLSIWSACSTVAVAEQPTRQPQKVACVVGVDQYLKRGFSDLRCAERDVEALSSELKKLGFRVVVLKGSGTGEQQATRANVLRQLEQLLNGVGKSDVVLLALSGHGQQLSVKQPDGNLKDEAFFCPVDAVKNDPQTLISLSYLLDDLLANHGGKNLLLVDACRDIPQDPSRGAKGIQGRIITVPEDTAVFFSCRAGQRSYENHQILQHGLFMYSIIQSLKNKTDAREEMTFFDLVSGASKTFSSAQVAQYISPESPQEPILAGSIPNISLGRAIGVGRQILVAPFTAAEAQSMQNEWAKHYKIQTSAANRTGIQMVLIPPGEYVRGTSDENIEAILKADTSGMKEFFALERPPHRVRITSPFLMAKCEINQDQFQKVMGRNPAYFSPTGRGRDKVSGLQTAHFPVERVSWFDCLEFCNKLSELEGKTACYDMRDIARNADQSIKGATVTILKGTGYRLPTEAEWEYSCRAGTTTPFHFGDRVTREQANVFGDYPPVATMRAHLNRTSPVGSYAPNNFGLRDMCGNVWEWCQDGLDETAYQKFSNQIAVNPVSNFNAKGVVIRGGSWLDSTRCCHSAVRSAESPSARTDGYGFRVVCECDPTAIPANNLK